MKGKLLTEFDLGNHQYKIYIIEDRDTDFGESVATKNLVTIKIGIIGDVDQVAETVLHEMQEGWLTVNGCRFVNSNSDLDPSKDCAFMIHHDQFQDMCQQVSTVIGPITEAIEQVWQQYN